MTELTHIFVFEAVGMGLALAAYPQFARALPPALAWGTARIAVPWLIAYLSLVPSALFSEVPFNRLTLLAFAVALVITSASVIASKAKQSQSISAGAMGLLRCVRNDGRHILTFEVFYSGVFVALAVYESTMSPVAGLGERMRDLAVFGAIFKQKTFPLTDPWLAGESVRYYTFGYFGHATVPMLAGLGPLSSYPLALASAGAQYAGALFLLFRALSLPLVTSLAGALAVCASSNVKSLTQIFAAGTYSWWDVSRVIPGTINEFPLWTATFGDLHPHYLMLFLLPLFLAVTIAATPGFFFAGGVLAAAWWWGANSWETPIGLLIFSAALILRAPGIRLRHSGKRIALALPLCALASLPFLLHQGSGPRGIALVTTHSSPVEIVLVFGFFLVPILVAAIRRDFGNRVAWALAGLGLAIVLGCEVVHIKDIYGPPYARLNTVFKLYEPAWTLFGVAAFLFVVTWRWRIAQAVWGLALAAYLIVGLPVRYAAIAPKDTGDGLSEVRSRSESDARLIEWMATKPLPGVLLEGPGTAYSLSGRIATGAGVRSFVTWSGHGYWWQFNLKSEVDRRTEFQKAFFSTLPNDCAAVKAGLIAQGIDYVVLGSLERVQNPPGRTAFLDSCLSVMHREGDSAIYYAR